MGVHGLWKLIESSGKPVPLETLENRVLSVDVSIWLYQLVKGFQDKAGQSVANAFLLGLFHRICKLLFYRIKPIFVFDGGVPALKRKTIAARQNMRNKAEVLGEKLRISLLENLAKQEALGKALGESFVIPKILQPKQDTLFKLPPLPTSQETEKIEDSDSDSEQEFCRYKDLRSIDISSEEFLSLPADMRHDMLTELKETRKENSWAKLHLMPEESGEFSNFQMSRLLKRRAIQVGIEKAESEMGTRGFTISDLQSILSDQGVELAQRIAADSVTKVLYTDKLKSDYQHLKDANEKVTSSSSKNKPDCKHFDAGNEFDVSKEENDIRNDSLTQNELLELIKVENSISSDVKPETINMDVFVTSTNLKNDFVKTEVKKELEVNDQSVENKSRNNEVELDHGTLPQSNSHCQLPSVLSITSHPKFISILDPGLSKEYTNELKLENKLEEQTPLVVITDKIKNPMPSNNNYEVSQQENVNENKTSSLESLSKQPEVIISFSEKNVNCEVDLSSDDSDDFIEVNNEVKNDNVDSSIAVNDMLSKMECLNKSVPTQIIINSIDRLEEDMFSDIFENKSKSENTVSDYIKFDENCSEVESHILSVSAISESYIISDKGKVGNTSTNKNDFIKNHIEQGNSRSSVSQLSVDDIIKMKKDLERESDNLRKETSREESIASSITEQITLDAQELLQLFGIPYITAPMEAEAQCAYLDLTHQSQGTITDDSDIWLFGAKNVYKNFFDQKKFVQQFKSTDISKCLHLERDEMIMLALLSGSDYTTGLTGVGAVTALEIIAHFPKTEKEPSIMDRLAHFADDYKKSKLKANIFSKLKRISLSEGFPSSEVIQAYMNPLVDQSTEPFSWSKPKLAELRRYAKEKFGWDHIRTDKILQPVFENLNRSQGQGTLHRYFEWNFDNTESQMSKRVEKAVTLLKTPSLLDTSPSSNKVRKKIIGNPCSSKASSSLDSNVIKSKTPAQIAREKAAKKVKELRKQGKFGPKPVINKKGN